MRTHRPRYSHQKYSNSPVSSSRTAPTASTVSVSLQICQGSNSTPPEALITLSRPFFNALTLPESLRDALLAEFGPEDLPQNTFYGDGAPIEPETVAHLQDAYREVMVEFPWQRGDAVLLDNVLAVHARNAFTGPRKVMTAMAIAQCAAELAVEDGAPA